MNNYTLLQNVIKNTLTTLLHLIDKAEAHVKSGVTTEEALLSASIAPDMFNFTKQVQITTDDARRNLFLLAGKEHVKMDDTEKSLEELRVRVQKTLDLITSLSEADFEGADDRHISLFWMGGKYVLGKDFIQEFAFNNFFFHAVTVYDILRKEGVQIGKMDFITKFSMHEA